MNAKTKIYAISTFFSLALLLLAIFLIYPTIKSVRSASAEIKLLKSDALFINSQSEKLDNFRRRYEEQKDNFQKIEQSFVDSQNPVEFIKFLEESAHASDVNININLVAGASGESEKKPQVVVFQISIKGSFSGIAEFSERLESGHYLAGIQKLMIKKANKQIAEKNEEGFYPQAEAIITIEAPIAPV